MDFFLHYIGIAGSARDFPKTVFTQRPTSLVLEHVPDGHPSKGKLLLSLGEEFPAGRWNCWGVPAGAAGAIGRLSPGDVILLMETSAGDAAIPALCQVKVFVPEEIPSLSRALWGETGFPFIFFFDTQPLSLTWPELRSRLGYMKTYKGSIGKVQRLHEDRVRHAGGSAELLAWLETKATPSVPSRFSLTPSLSGARDPSVIYDIQNEHDELVTASIDPEPTLTDDDAELRSSTSYSYPRTEAFRLDVRRLYDERCAICSLGLHSPEGHPEVQSAHIFPRHLKGRNDLRNGISLCRMHHWALDTGWISLSDERKILVRPNLPRSADYTFIRDFEAQRMREPSATAFSPHPLYLRAHRRLFGFEDGGGVD